MRLHLILFGDVSGCILTSVIRLVYMESGAGTNTVTNASLAMAATDRQNPNLDDFVGLNWSCWVEKVNILPSDGESLSSSHSSVFWISPRPSFSYLFY